MVLNGGTQAAISCIMKQILFLIFLLATSQTVFSQGNIPEYTTQKGLVVLRVVPKDRTAKIFLAGHQAAVLDLKKDAQLLSVTVIKGDQKQKLELRANGEFYEVKNLPEQKPYELEFQVQVQNKPQQMRLKIDSTKP